MSTTAIQPWRSDVDAVFVVRLWHFNAKLSVYSLDDHCSIIRVTKREIAQIPSAERSPGALVAASFGLQRALVAPSFGSQIAPGVLAVKAITSGDSYEDAKDRANHKFLSLIRSLRLLKQGSPYTGEGIAYQPGIPGSRRDYWPWEGLPLPSYSGDYEFKRSERSTLKAIYRAVRSVSSRFELALRRLDMAYSRELDEDRLIDCWVALESLFLPGISDELSFRASLRIAYFLGRRPDERLEIYERMRESYKARSRVVHGQEVSVNVRQVAQQTEEALREALGRAVQAGTVNVGALDADIARGGAGGVTDDSTIAD
jgi:hypothetical protein